MLKISLRALSSPRAQRLLGIVPNFYVTYDPNAAPLTAAQKFHLGLRTLLDPEVGFQFSVWNLHRHTDAVVVPRFKILALAVAGIAQRAASDALADSSTGAAPCGDVVVSRKLFWRRLCEWKNKR